MLNIKVSLQSRVCRHGSKGPKPTKVRTAVGSKFSALMKSRKTPTEEVVEEPIDDSAAEASDSNNNNSQAEVTTSTKRQPKEYGSHNGNVHVHVMVDDSYETDDDIDSITNYITNMTSAFEAKPSFDLKKAKNDYRVYKDEVVTRYAKTFGSQLSERTATEMLRDLSKKAFIYTSHQIIITVSSDVQIEGARFNDEDGLYYITFKSKMIYRSGRSLLSPAELEYLEEVDDENIKLTQTSLVRIPITLRFDTINERWVIQYPNQGYKAVDGYNLNRP